MKKEKVYKILFIQLGEVYEIFAKNIYQSDMYAFLEVEEFIFGSDDQLVVDPSSEKLKNEFKKVKKSFHMSGSQFGRILPLKSYSAARFRWEY